jgi:hypothetical protein
MKKVLEEIFNTDIETISGNLINTIKQDGVKQIIDRITA